MATFLLISPEEWTAQAVSKHHYAMTLATRGHKVLFLNPPTATTDITLSTASGRDNLLIVNAPRVARGLRFLPAVLRRAVEGRWLRRLEALTGTTIDIVWSFENSRFFDLRFAGDRLKIYHQVDLNQDFHAEEAAASADVCFCTTDPIRRRLAKVSDRVHKIHHGTALVTPPRPLTPQQAHRFAGTHVNAAYIGSLDIPYLDCELLIATVRAHPQVRFHFIGACSESSPLLQMGRHLPNTVWWGRQASESIPSLLAQVDVVLCTYLARRHRDQLASPHKLMEYFASGKVIVATYTDEYKDKRDLLVMVDDEDDYVAAFGSVVGDLPAYNAAVLQARRKAFAEGNTYERQVDRIFAIASQTAPRSAHLLALRHCAETP